MHRQQKKFLRLYQPVHPQFERYCRAHAYGAMPAADLINETLLIAFQKIDAIKQESSFLSFLIGISRKVLANANRKEKPSRVLDDKLVEIYPDPDDAIQQQIDINYLHKALAQLPQAQREALILFEISGFSLQEIANIQEAGLSAVKQRLRRGRKNLADIITSQMTPKPVDHEQ